MKKVLLSVILFAAVASFTMAQTVYSNYEDGGTNVAFGGWDGGSFAVIDNPDATGLNTSAKVGHATTGTTEWAGFAFDGLGGTFDWANASDSVFTMLVWSSVAANVLFKIENADNSAATEVAAAHTGGSSWELLTFDLGTPDNSYGANYDDLRKFVFFFNPGVASAGENWYIDDITSANVAFVPGGDVDVTFKVTDASQAAAEVKVELSHDPGNYVMLVDDGTGSDNTAGDFVWTGTTTLVGGTLLAPTAGDYTYDVLVDGSVDAEADDLALTVVAGAGTQDVNLTLGGFFPELAEAIDFGATSPTVDGTIDAVWDGATQYDIQKIFGSDGFDNADDFSAWFKVGYDALGLYVLINVTADDYWYNEGTHGQDWEKDNIEVYLDMNTDALADGVGPSGGLPGGQANNGHYQFAARIQTDYTAPSWAPNTARGFVTTAVNIGDAYNAQQELFIDWLDVANASGGFFTVDGTTTFGFDISMADNDDVAGGAARNRKNWVHDGTDGSEPWSNMDASGEVLCVSTTSVELINSDKMMVYPNPVQDVLFIRNARNIKTVSVTNILGAEVARYAPTAADRVSVNVGELSKGIYMVTMEDTKGNITTQKVVKR